MVEKLVRRRLMFGLGSKSLSWKFTFPHIVSANAGFTQCVKIYSIRLIWTVSHFESLVDIQSNVAKAV